MATADSVKAKMQRLIDSANAKTGGNDSTLTGAVGALIAGFGQGGGIVDTSAEDGLITRTLTHYANDRVTEIGSKAFDSNNVIEHVSFPNVEKLNSNVFNACSALKTIYFPKLKRVGGNDFKGCSSLTEASFPAFNSGTPNFNGCSSLEKLDFGGLNSISNGAYANCAKLRTVVLRGVNQPSNVPIATLVNVGAFTGTPFAAGGSGGTVYVPASLIESYKTATNWVTLYEAGTCNFVAIEGSEYE